MRIKKWTALLLVLLIFVGSAPFFAAAKTQKTVIRVAFPIQAGLTEVDEQGNYSGYVYEYLQEISQYTNWDYEFVQVPGDINDSILSLMDMMEKGEIDLMGGMLYDEQFAERFDYSGYNFGLVYTQISVLDENSDVWEKLSPNGEAIRVAVSRASGPRVEELLTYCKQNHLNVELVECGENKTQLEALQDGSADAMLNVSLNPVEGIREIVRFAPRPYYFVTTKGRTDLLARLNYAVHSIEQTDPYFSTTLYEKYFAKKSNKLTLTKAEKEYIQNSEPLKVGVLLGLPPFQYQDADGKLQGVSLDLLNHISEQTGLSFEAVTAQTQEEIDQLLAQGKVDLVSGMTYDYDSARKRGFAMTRPYMSSQYTLVLGRNISESSLKGKKLALPNEMIYHGYFIGNVVRYSTAEDCIRAVNNGEADYTYADSYLAQYYINQAEFGSLRLVPQTYGPHQTCIGVAEPVSTELLGILNKVILQLPLEQMQTFIYRGTTHQEQFSLKNWMIRNPLQGVLLVMGIALFIIALLGWGLLTRLRMNRKMALSVEKYTQVYELASEHFFEYDYRTNQLMVSMQTDGEDKKKLHVFRYGKADKESIDGIRAEEFLTFLMDHESGVVEKRELCEDGEYHWLRITMKTIHDNEEPACIIGKIAYIDEEMLEKEALLEQAQRDSLTHLFNLATTQQQVIESIETLGKTEYGALILMDVDNFKLINDTYGHLEGDQVLTQVAETLCELFHGEVLGRPGGDEFTVYLSHVESRKAVEVKCRRLCEHIRSRSVGADCNRKITCSVGVAMSSLDCDYSALYRSADEALYRAKRGGRDRFEIAED